MAAVTADQLEQVRGLDNAIIDSGPVKSGTTVYLHTLCNFDANGDIVNATDAASERFAGEVCGFINGSGDFITSITGNASGTVKAVFRYGHQMRLGVGAAARLQANVGKTVCISTNMDVLGATATNDIVCGRLDAFDGSTSFGWVTLRAMGISAAA